MTAYKISLYNTAWIYCRTLLGESTKLSFMMAYDNGWLPIFSKFKNQLYHISIDNDKFKNWYIWLESIPSNSVSWEYVHKNEKLIELKYALEQFCEK